MKTYLVTGGAGFIGANYIHYLLGKYNREVRIINYDKLSYAGDLSHLEDIAQESNYRFVQGDILDKKKLLQVLKEEQVDYVVHFAAETHVDRSLDDDRVFEQTNVLGTLTLLQALQEVWSKTDYENKKMVHISTDEVYGELGGNGYFEESMLLHPRNPYSASKAAAEMMVMAYIETYHMPICVTRCSNNFGPYQYTEKLIPKCICKCLKHEKIPVYGDGQNIRDWLYVTDHCNAIDTVLNHGKIGSIYNVGGHNEKRAIDIVTYIIEYLQKNYDASITTELIDYVSDRKGHDKRYAMNPKKLQSELGWSNQVTFEEGMKETIDWYYKHKNSLEDYEAK